jgi:hypothetical protein
VGAQFVLNAICMFFIVGFAILGRAPGASARVGADAIKPAQPPAIVVGFVGGFIARDSSVHGGVKLAERLRKAYPSGVYVKVFENRKGEEAHQDILRLLDANHDGKLTFEEKQKARIVIYGHSWGGSETVQLARELQRDKIPVLLTVQVDSVWRFNGDDSVIPTNVVQAANFYQANGLVRGRAAIRAADPAQTEILGNFKFDYSARPVECEGYPWYARIFEKAHIGIENDPRVLDQVEALIRSKLTVPPSVTPSST